jgi:hypothetical protein
LKLKNLVLKKQDFFFNNTQPFPAFHIYIKNTNQMKKNLTYSLLFVITILLTGCFGYNTNDDDFPIYEPPQSQYTPIYMEREIFENSTEILPAQTIINSGKIYVKDGFLFINEVHEGFHIIKNSDPTSPVNIGFLKALGSSDMSIKNNTIYIDNALDLIALSFNDTFDRVVVTKRIRDIFPNPLAISPDGFPAPHSEGHVVVGWE